MSESPQRLTQIVEAALFAAGEPLTIERIQRLFDDAEAPDRKRIETILDELAEAYADRGVRLVDTGGGWQFQTASETNPWIHRLFQARAPRFSRAVLETLAIIAYRQPTTRAEVEDIRGVNLSSGVLKTLTEREWVKAVGRKDVPGRPVLYGTTDQFLSYFGLASLDALPPLKALEEGDVASWLEESGDPSQPPDSSDDD